MSDTSNADASPDADPRAADLRQATAPPPPNFNPYQRPAGTPSPLQMIANWAERARQQQAQPRVNAPAEQTPYRPQPAQADHPTAIASALFDAPGSSPARTQRPQPQPWSAPWQPPQRSPPGTPPLSPTGQPPPMRRFTPYLAALPNRPPGQWGDPPAFPRMPMGFEVPGILRGVGGWFAQNGSGFTSMLGGQSAAFANAFIKSYTQGMESQNRMQLEQMQLHATQLAEQAKQENDAYAEVFNEYSALGGQTPTRGPNAGVSLAQALETVAQRYNDSNMLTVLATRGPGAALQLMQSRDAKWQDAHVAGKQSAKETEQAAADAELGLPPEPGAGGQPTVGGAPTAASIGAAPAVAVAPGDQGPPDAADPPKDVSGTPDKLKPWQQIGMDELRGVPHTGLSPRAKAAVEKFAADKEMQLQNLADEARAKHLSQDQIAKRLDAIGPGIGSEWNDIVDGNAGMPGGISATGAKPYWRALESLAITAKPGWNAKDAENLGAFTKDYYSGPKGNRIVAAARMGSAGRTLLQELKNIPEGATVPQNIIDEFVARGFTGDPKWAGLFTALNTYIQESMSVASPTGRAFEGDIQAARRAIDYRQGTKALRAIIQVDAKNALAGADELEDDFRNMTGKERSPHYNEKNIELLRWMTQLDPEKGFGGVANLPPELQGLGMGSGGTPAASQPAGGLPPGWSVEPVQ